MPGVPECVNVLINFGRVRVWLATDLFLFPRRARSENARSFARPPTGFNAVDRDIEREPLGAWTLQKSVLVSRRGALKTRSRRSRAVRSSVTRRETEALSPGVEGGRAKVYPTGDGEGFALVFAVFRHAWSYSGLADCRVGERTKTNTMARVNEKVVVGGVVCWARERHWIRVARVT